MKRATSYSCIFVGGFTVISISLVVPSGMASGLFAWSYNTGSVSPLERNPTYSFLRKTSPEVHFILVLMVAVLFWYMNVGTSTSLISMLLTVSFLNVMLPSFTVAWKPVFWFSYAESIP